MHFPEDKRNFMVANIYKGSRDGWKKENFGQYVYNQGPIIILVSTTLGGICGGFTSINIFPGEGFKKDNEAFVFNLKEKFSPVNFDNAIFMRNNGF